jgi:hypothetical protein
MIERREDKAGSIYVVTVECPFCGVDLSDKSYPRHLQYSCKDKF